MKGIRKTLAIITGKILIRLSKILGNQGTDFPGKIARRIYPEILTDLSENITDEIVIITGTNGKTTTSNLVASILKEKNISFVHNTAGANLITGITTAFIKDIDILGYREFEYAVLETDEANVPLLLNEITPGLILITNFFRDQSDRFGELDKIITLIKDAVDDKPIDLVLNSDDPLATSFEREPSLSTWFFGFDNTIYDTKESVDIREGRHCIICGQELIYHRFHYEQLGKYKCPKCKNKNAERNFTVHDFKLAPNIELKVNGTQFKTNFQGFYNAYNILAAVSLTKLLGIEIDYIVSAINKYKPQAGRMESFEINEKDVVLVLVKNSAGFNQALFSITQDYDSKTIFFALNDNSADGTDVSWIWDANVEGIFENNNAPTHIVCTGKRSGDIAVRFKYSGCSENKITIEADLSNAVNLAINSSLKKVYIICTYTALFEVRDILIKMQEQSTGKSKIDEKQYQREEV
ncbi:putative amino acid ligase found clustered with an amidotransferase [Candidatus Syntrophocurvum alkaliphilum]|uniref:Lipid II isoglutaminyl synthase (glutamine-hydrolyzing) subunit MurT n=1 Tax=Candidatus Syntrophocurvum alkaliphilum TaxID=2293317 RepID=A0A6I6DJZ0_9FIRM|nr:MurT ligase domain-containing protein [Candidatus Syntrophocurvum alkaliphilum]QGT99681.1 putative amino acid ligase found clustered with an amidotransferase [Candidatus Syntrophocurvum alkaliphilum]